VDKLHIILVGRRNIGKSSLINRLTGQQTAIVSDTAGTTTDPVKKSYEIPGVAKVMFIDTAGIDDCGELGLKRRQKTFQLLPEADLALIVFSQNQFEETEKLLVVQLQKLHIPFFLIHNKSDLYPLKPEIKKQLETHYKTTVTEFSATTDTDVSPILRQIKRHTQQLALPSLLGDLLRPQDIVLLVTPIDTEAPTNRIILPQVQTLRNILDHHCISIVLQPQELAHFLKTTAITPRLVVTDSQAFKQVAEILPPSVPLTSFSILLARQKGNFKAYQKGTLHIPSLKNNDRILILESCSHHHTCEDIGQVKIPMLLQKKTGKKLIFDFISALDPLPASPQHYALVIQCGGCMLTRQQLQNRIQPFIDANIPVSNYGMTLAWLNGIFARTLEVYKKY